MKSKIKHGPFLEAFIKTLARMLPQMPQEAGRALFKLSTGRAAELSERPLVDFRTLACGLAVLSRGSFHERFRAHDTSSNPQPQPLIPKPRPEGSAYASSRTIPIRLASSPQIGLQLCSDHLPCSAGPIY